MKHCGRLCVRTKNEIELVTEIDRRIRTMFRSENHESLDPEQVRLLLANFLTWNLGRSIDAESIRATLNSHGYLPSQLLGDARVRRRMRDVNRAYITSVQRLLINGNDIDRREAVVATRNLVELGKHVMLEGTAGTGKSCVVAQALTRLSAHDVPCLVVRLDQLQSTHLSSPAVGASLRLPESPAITLGEFAGGQPCVLCIDQLDALSIVSARQQTIWGPFNEMLNEAERYPNMRLLFACRSFDLEQDPRLRRLVAQQERIERVPIRPLEEATIHRAIDASGTTSTLNNAQVQILSNPLHLFLFLEASRAGPVDFTQAGELFDAFWKYKQQSVEERLEQRGSWMTAIGTLCHALSGP